MLKREDLKFEKSNVLQLLVLITAGIVVVFGLRDLIRYYTQTNPITLTTPIATFLSLFIMVMVSVFIALKGKSFLGALILLALKVLNSGTLFIRQVINETLDFSSFAGFETLTYFVLATLLIVFLVLELRKGSKPVLETLKRPNQFILVVVSLVFFVLFRQVMFAMFLNSILLMLVLFDEERFVPHIITHFAIVYLFSLIDYFIVLDKNPNYQLPLFTGVETVLGIALLVFAFVSVIKPNFLATNPQQLTTKEN